MPLGSRIMPSAGQNPPMVAPQTQAKPIAEAALNRTAVDKAAKTVVFLAEQPKYGFGDIVMNKGTFDAIQDILTIYEKRDLIFNQWGLGATHKQQNRAGINLYGHPGTGKSMAAHAIANQLGRKILTVDYSQIESKYVGETSKNLTAMFDYAKENNVIIFFDEADALLSKRVTEMSSANDVSVNQTRSVLLMLINDFDDLILFASNFVSNYDPAFMRRILGHVKFELPDEENRLKLWRLYIPPTLPTNANLNELAAKYGGVSGADIANAVLTAALRAARLNERTVQHAYFLEAIERIIGSKDANTGETVTKRVVSAEYVKEQIGRLPK